MQANSKQSTGYVRLDINLLKSRRIDLKEQDPAPPMTLLHGNPSSSSPDWLKYVYRTSHPVLRWLPTACIMDWRKPARGVGLPGKADRRARPGTGWTADELNHILQEHVVDGALTTFSCHGVEWESELFRGVRPTRCYPFKMPSNAFMASTHRCKFILSQVHTSIYSLLHSAAPRGATKLLKPTAAHTTRAPAPSIYSNQDGRCQLVERAPGWCTM